MMIQFFKSIFQKSKKGQVIDKHLAKALSLISLQGCGVVAAQQSSKLPIWFQPRLERVRFLSPLPNIRLSSNWLRCTTYNRVMVSSSLPGRTMDIQFNWLEPPSHKRVVVGSSPTMSNPIVIQPPRGIGWTTSSMLLDG